MSNQVQSASWRTNVKVSKAIKLGLYLVLFLPLLFTNFTFFPWHYGKTEIFQIIVEVLVFFWLYYRLSFRTPSSDGVNSVEESFGKLNWLDWSILIFLVILIITAVTGVNPQNSFWGNQARANGIFTWLHFAAFYFLLIRFLSFRANPAAGGGGRGISYSLFFIINTVVALLVSFASFFPQILPSVARSISEGGIIGSRAFLAAYLLPSLGVALYLVVQEIKDKIFYKKFQFWFYASSVIILSLSLFFTSNRGSFVGVAIGFVAGLILSAIFSKMKKVRLAAGAGLIILAALLAIFLVIARSPKFQYDWPRLARLSSISFSVGTAQTRLIGWQVAWDGIKERPFLGWGWGNYNVIFDKFYDPAMLRFGFTETVWDKPHNWPLEIAATGGIAGAAAYLAINIIAFVYFLRRRQIILASTVVAYFVQMFFLFETTNSLILWFSLLAVASVAQKSDSPPRTRAKILGILNIRYFKYFALFFVLCSLFFVLYRFNYLPLKTSYLMRQAELATSFEEWRGYAAQVLAGKDDELKRENVIFLAEKLVKFDKGEIFLTDDETKELALKLIEELEESNRVEPLSLAYPVWGGQVYTVLGERFDKKYFQDAERIFQAARQVSPKKQEALFLLGRLYLLEKDFPKAIAAHREAVELDETIEQSRWFLGLALVAAGERRAGLEEIEKARGLWYGKEDERNYVFDLYALEEDYSKLIEEYKKLVEMSPANLNWYIKLATVYALSGNKKEALDTVNYVVGMFPPLKTEADKFIKEYKLDK